MTNPWAGASVDEIIAAACAEFDKEINRKQTTRTELRLGRKGSISVVLEGEKRGAWFDHEIQSGGLLRRPAPPCSRQSSAPRANGHDHDIPDHDAAGGGPDEEASGSAERDEKLAHVSREWQAAKPLDGTDLGSRYLREERGLPGPYPTSLRYGVRVRLSPNAMPGPALSCAVTNDAGETVGHHLIKLDASNGHAVRDADGRRIKLSYGPVSEGTVRLGDANSEVLVIGEGVETALTRRLVGPADIRACVGSLRRVEPGRRHKRVEIIADVDQLKKARTLAQSYATAGYEAFVVEVPEGLGAKADLNDLLLALGPVHVERAVVGAPQYRVAVRQYRQLDIGSDAEVADHVLRELERIYGPLVCDEGKLWRYDHEYWQEVNSATLARVVHKWDGATWQEGGSKRPVERALKLSQPKIRSIHAIIAQMRERAGTFGDGPRGLACDSGFIRLEKDGSITTEPHARRHRVRHIIPGRYSVEGIKPSIAGSLLEKLIVGCFKDDLDIWDKMKLVQEIAGAAAFNIATKIAQPKAAIFYGPSAENGKSQVIDMRQGLVPPDAKCSVPPAKFSDERFRPILIGKLLNTAGELSSNAIIGDAYKEIVTGDLISGREAYGPVVTFRPGAQHVFGCNTLPPFRNGVDAGVIRRLQVLGFNRKIPMLERILGLGTRIATDERDLLLDFAVEGAQRLVKQSVFTMPASSVELLEKWVQTVDPVRGWLGACAVIDDVADPIASKDLYANFQMWCDGQGISRNRLPSASGFMMRLRAAQPRLRIEHRTSGNFVVNLRLQADAGAA